MDFLGWLLGTGPDNVPEWKAYAEHSGAQYRPPQGMCSARLQLVHEPWAVQVDLESHNLQLSILTYTRVWIAFELRRDFRMDVHRAGISDALAGVFGGNSDLLIGDPTLDFALVIRGTNETVIRALFMDEQVRRLLPLSQGFGLFVMRSDQVPLPESPAHAGILLGKFNGVERNIPQLNSRVELIVQIANELQTLGIDSAFAGHRDQR